MDVFAITAQERSMFQSQFNNLKPVNGIVTGDQAKGFFLQSQLPLQVLGAIWALADTDVDGKMNLIEFSIACKLIHLKLRGVEVPNVLPASLAQLTQPQAGNLQGNIGLMSAVAPPQVTGNITSMASSISQVHPTISPPSGANSPSGSLQMPLPGMAAVVKQPVATQPIVSPLASTVERTGNIESVLTTGSQSEWAVPHASKLKYTQLFNTTDRTRSGFLSGVQARSIMMASQLPQPILAQIWGLSDIDVDGKLSCEEFVLAMHLCDLARTGEKIPASLSHDLIPPTFRRYRQNSLTVANSDHGDPLAGLSSVSFEDKRKENFEKGQAELERRRKALLEIQRKEQEERERKEREEQEKREKIRLEQEKKRQQELEKQLQKQRELEQEKEEQRRRAQEQREAARKEMERQRQLEWEKQRSLELQAQRQREQENVLKMKAKNQNLNIELSQLNEKVKQLSQKISETRSGVTSVKTVIDGMRTTRDTQLSQMSVLKTRLKEHNSKLLTISQEKARIEAKNKMNVATDAIGQEQAQIAFNNKQITLKNLREKLQDMDKQIAVKLEDIENNNSQLGDLKVELGNLIKDCELLYPIYDEKRKKVLEMKGFRGESISNWGNSAWNSSVSSWSEETNVESSYRKYRALYEFVARNNDELSFQPGDIIMVPADHNAEPGWLAGELRGATGWFPEAYVEPVDGGIPTTFSEPDTVHKTPLEEITEVPENVSDNGSAVIEVPCETGAPPVPKMPSLVLGLGTPVEKRVVALFTFFETLPCQLGFTKGSIIRVTENQDIWWYGELDNKEGWFPKTYVKLASDNFNDIKNIQSSVNTSDNTSVEEQEYYVALYAYQSLEGGDLNFNQGEVILVIKKEGDWWTGVIADRTGIFPSNYVQKADTQPVVTPQVEGPTITLEKKTSEPVVDLEQKNTEGRALTPDFTTLSQEVVSSGGEDSDSKGSKGKKPEIATVIAPYQATSNEQLNLQRGQLIMIRKKTTTGWWEGELQAKGKKRQIGWFPASYVKLLGGGNTSTPPPGAVSGMNVSATQKATVSNRTDQAAGDSIGDKVIALYQYKALNPDELSFEKDDVITLLSKDEPAWWKGELNDQTGLFPSNYVAPLSNSVRRRKKISKNEKRRQQHIKELILTEQAYIDDMSVVHDVFERPLRESKVLSPEQISKIFVNWRDIIMCNYMFLRALRVRREMSQDGVIRMIGDILCENLPRMTVYVRFCSCQLSAASLLQKLTEESLEFKTLSKTCQSDPRTKGMPLSSFLIKPMQRITKYPLIIQKILEYTPAGHPDRLYLKEALAKAEEFCMQVNEGVREQENSDRLEWLQTHVVCEGLAEPLIFNSLTNSVGPRKFLNHGDLTKSKSGKELVGFLLNDMILLTQPNRSLSQPFSFERHSSFFFKIYKEPLLLSETTVLSTLDTVDSLEIKLEHNKIIYSLNAISHHDRTLWLKKISKAQLEVLHSDKCKLQKQLTKQAQFGAVGRILVVVLEGQHLKSQMLGAKREIYCEVSMGYQENRTALAIMVGTDVKWNTSMQFLIKNLNEDVLCVTVMEKGYFSPDEFLGRTEIRVSDILSSKINSKGPLIKILPLYEVESGVIHLKLDLRLFETH